MQCAACNAVYPRSLNACPRCKTSVAAVPSASEGSAPKVAPRREARCAPPQDKPPDKGAPAGAPSGSTLIEFPGTGRAARPQWRKELSERVREIQQRRALEAAREAEEEARRLLEQSPEPADPETIAAPPLGLVPPPVTPELNPIVAAALRRLERARQPTSSTAAGPRAGLRGAAATAVARVVEESYEEEPRPLPTKTLEKETSPLVRIESAPVGKTERTERTLEAARTISIRPKHSASPEAIRASAIAVPASQPATRPAESQPKSRRVVAEVIDDALIARREAEAAVAATVTTVVPETFDDHAPIVKRIAAALLDLLAVAFLSSPCAAIIELANGNWADPRVAASMGGIIVVVMFLYLATSVALAGRTWGMSFVSLRVVEAETGLAPTTGQAVRRAFFYMLSLALFGLGILYGLFDDENRAAHDRLSGTMVVLE